MRSYRIALTPKSPWATPWHADTIFGCLCWAYREVAGPKGLETWLERYEHRDPPFVVSNAFPAGLLPFPLAAMVKKDQPDQKVKAVWTSETEFRSWAKGETKELVAAVSPFMEYAMAHAAIGRTTNRADEGQLYEIDREYWKTGYAGEKTLDLYVKAGDEDWDGVWAALQLLAWKGFGRKGGSGFGEFTLGEPVCCEWLDAKEAMTGFVGLSHWIPAAQDPVDGVWNLHVSNPKFQGNMVRQFAKGTLTFLKAGAVFHVDELRSWYGRTIWMPRPEEEMAKARHYALCFPAPVMWDGRG